MDLRSNQLNLAHALVRVICQVKWESLSGFQPSQISDEFGRVVSSLFPYVDEIPEVQILLTADGPQKIEKRGSFKYSSFDRSRSLTLTANFIAYETSDYENHQVFLADFKLAFTALRELVNIPRFSRLGYRYTNQFPNFGVDDISEKFSGGVIGKVGRSANLEIENFMSQAVYANDEIKMIVRSLYLPAGAALDEGIKAIDVPSWVLDFDSFEEYADGVEMDGDYAVSRATLLSEMASREFENSLTPQGVIHTEGK